MAYKPNTIARYFLHKYGDSGITPMKLIKLVYIAHGWYLGLFDKTLIDQNPEAWKYGPVIPDIYSTYKRYGNKPIDEKPLQHEIYDRDVEKFLDKIWEVYGKYNALQLSSMTHQEGTPWTRVWESLENGNRTTFQIPENDIRDYYKRLSNRNQREAEA